MTQAVCNSFKQELFEGVHNLASAGDVIKFALYTNAATLDATTTVYSATNEVSGTGYTAGGVTLANQSVVLDSGTAVFDADDAQWTGATFTTSQALMYNSTQTNKAIAVYDFGGDISVSSGTLNVIFPTPDATNGLLRLA